MPIKTPHTKEERREVVHDEMHKYKHGDLHSGSKEGPVVHDRDQAIAIALNEAGMSKQPHSFRESKRETHGFGHTGAQKQGHHRMSGHPGGHRVGGKHK